MEDATHNTQHVTRGTHHVPRTIPVWTFLPTVPFFVLAYAAILGGLPRWVRPALLTFSGVASNFAGVPLAFAFISTLGRVGLATTLLGSLFGINIYNQG